MPPWHLQGTPGWGEIRRSDWQEKGERGSSGGSNTPLLEPSIGTTWAGDELTTEASGTSKLAGKQGGGGGGQCTPAGCWGCEVRAREADFVQSSSWGYGSFWNPKDAPPGEGGLRPSSGPLGRYSCSWHRAPSQRGNWKLKSSPRATCESCVPAPHLPRGEPFSNKG